jgi:hypothetical protein
VSLPPSRAFSSLGAWAGLVRALLGQITSFTAAELSDLFANTKVGQAGAGATGWFLVQPNRLSWNNAVTSGLSPQCGYAVVGTAGTQNVDDGTARLYYQR